MPEKQSPVPISGEILVEGRPAGAGPPPPADIVEAEYETLAPGREAAPPRAMAAVPPAGLDWLRRGAARPARRGGGGALFWAGCLLAAAGAFWVSGGHAAFERQAAFRAREAAGLHIARLESRIEHGGARALLLIDGEAANGGASAARLPDLAINVLDRSGRTTHYFLGTNGRLLAAGERFSFSGRLAAPKEGVKSVSVTFRE
ncbi:hypothetical protein [Chelativorans intermedius]|nr:hypothetical protein [Chelativorans intermedius]MCT8997985.1 hypothetical protein [Chelativorans intermedius]